jgi:predicted negative regulator of RcsB-dependent stress response
MNLSNDRGQEALGYLSIALDELPQLQDNLEFLALRGSSYALAGKPELGWKDLSHEGLKQFTELGYWKSFTLAGLEDWDQAYNELPKDVQMLSGYPRPLLEKLGLKLAEAALRGGDVPLAEKILVLLERDRSTLKPWTAAGLDYLRGEAARQAKDTITTRKLWEPLIQGKDRLYRARAGLALTMLELQEGKINRDKAIDRLEALRYAWRGDELEAQINYMLGRLYLDNDQYVKGFAILRDASTMALPDSNIGKEITGYMATSYSDLILKDKDLTPLDAATIYEEFKELTPSGDEGNAVIQRLAERLVEADLLDRASALLQHQVDYRVQGAEKGRVATRLAAIYLIDKNPRPAMAALDAAEAAYNSVADMSEAEKKEHTREISLLRARALSRINRTADAIALLNTYPPDPDINALRADIAWEGGLWEDAGEALQDLILDEAIDIKRPLTARQADLILNRAVALSLANDRVALANMRTDYLAAMNQTSRAQVFDVISRPRKVSTVADRETIANIVSETDMFKDFLDGYRKVDAEAKAAGKPSQ